MQYTESQREFLNHVQDRMMPLYHQTSLNCKFDLEREIVTFPLWNLSGQLKGIQIYNWKGDKRSFNNCAESKYWTVAKSGPVIFGLEYLNYSLKYCFISEGIFDALSLLPYGNSLAMLTNDPKHIRQQLSLLPFEIVAVCDEDKAGKKMAKFADHVLYCKSGKDANSMNKEQLLDLLGDFAIPREFDKEFFHKIKVDYRNN